MPIYLGSVEAKKLYLGGLQIYGSSSDSGDDDSTYPSQAIDLGLPSGLRWAAYNAQQCDFESSKWPSTTDYTNCGGFYQFGPEDSTGTSINVAKYRDWSNTFFGNDIGYDESYVTTMDNGGNIDTSTLTLNMSSDPIWIQCMYDDTTPWYREVTSTKPGRWRMPTRAEFAELYTNTNISVDSRYGVSYVKFTNKSDSSKYIIIPTGGLCTCATSSDAGGADGDGYICLWTSEAVDIGSETAHAAGGLPSKIRLNGWAFTPVSRAYSLNIRPVFDTSITE